MDGAKTFDIDALKEAQMQTLAALALLNEDKIKLETRLAEVRAQLRGYNGGIVDGIAQGLQTAAKNAADAAAAAAQAARDQQGAGDVIAEEDRPDATMAVPFRLDGTDPDNPETGTV